MKTKLIGLALALCISTISPAIAKVADDVATTKYQAEQGDKVAQFNLGKKYYFGQGVPQDYAKALYWFQKSANQGDAQAQNIIGVMYEYGQGVRQNKPLAKDWYGKACDNGFQKGCDNYRELTEEGW